MSSHGLGEERSTYTYATVFFPLNRCTMYVHLFVLTIFVVLFQLEVVFSLLDGFVYLKFIRTLLYVVGIENKNSR